MRADPLFWQAVALVLMALVLSLWMWAELIGWLLRGLTA